MLTSLSDEVKQAKPPDLNTKTKYAHTKSFQLTSEDIYDSTKCGLKLIVGINILWRFSGECGDIYNLQPSDDALESVDEKMRLIEKFLYWSGKGGKIQFTAREQMYRTIVEFVWKLFVELGILVLVSTGIQDGLEVCRTIWGLLDKELNKIREKSFKIVSISIKQ